MAAKASTTLNHRTVPREEERAFPHFVHMQSCRLDPPQTDGACWLHAAQATSTDHGLLRVAFSGRFLHHVTSPGQLHHSEQ